jgi:hypothetical protein
MAIELDSIEAVGAVGAIESECWGGEGEKVLEQRGTKLTALPGG